MLIFSYKFFFFFRNFVPIFINIIPHGENKDLINLMVIILAENIG